MKRRDFGRLGGAGAGSLFSVGGAWAASAPGTVAEPGREIPVVSESDVVVCGAGPAGVCAALAAARRGARTHLVEVHGALGGIWTSGLLAYILDFNNKPGLMSEIVERATKQDGRAFTKSGNATCTFDPEILKIVLEEMCAEAGVQVQFHTRIVAVAKNSAGRLTHGITESKSGREAIGGRIFVDCTGDGDVGARAGCGFDWGHPETGATQPMSLIALVTGIQAEEVEAFYREEKGEWAKPKDALRAEMTRGGQSPSYAKPSLFRLRDDLFILMSNHEYEVKGIDVRDVTAATLRARKELHAQINGLRSLGGVWKNIRIVATPEQIGVREGRRLHGLYTVCADDLREGRSQPDAVCKATFPVDVHSTNPKKEKGIESAGFRAKPYDIPLRSLIAKDVTGLMMAGRCISGDFLAHSSYRVTGNAAAMGEAAGAVAAIAAKTNRLPQDVSLKEIS